MWLKKLMDSFHELCAYIWYFCISQDKWNWNPVAGYSLYYEYSKHHPYAGLGSQEGYTNVSRSKYTEHQGMVMV
jgi:hypothetical protein